MPADLRPCVEVLTAVHASDNYPTRWPDDPARWLSPSNLEKAWVATLNPGIVGHIAAGWLDEEPQESVLREAGCVADGLGEVMRLFVHPDFRGAGIAENLVDAALSHVQKQSRVPFLAVNARRERAHRFYERYGWRFAGEGPGDIVMPDGRQQMLRYYVFLERRPADGDH